MRWQCAAGSDECGTPCCSLRRWLASHHAVMPSRAMLGRIWDEVAQAREDATPSVYLNGFEVRRYQGKLWWVKSRSFF
ncbi:TilS substrate-binding domain-containing protein [Enterobacter mori]